MAEAGGRGGGGGAGAGAPGGGGGRGWCHGCGREVQLAAGAGAGASGAGAGAGAGVGGAPVCPACGGDFVEVLEEVSEPSRPEAQVVITADARGGGAALWPMILAEILTSPLLAGTRFNAGTLTTSLLGESDSFGASPGDFISGDALLEHVMNRMLENYVPTSTPTRPAVIEALPRVGPGAATLAEGCPICLGSFSNRGPGGDGKDEEEVLQLPCGHCFHGGCIRPWLREHNTCPVCRDELPGADLPRPAEEGEAVEGSEGEGGGLEVVGTALSPAGPGRPDSAAAVEAEIEPGGAVTAVAGEPNSPPPRLRQESITSSEPPEPRSELEQLLRAAQESFARRGAHTRAAAPAGLGEQPCAGPAPGSQDRAREAD